MKQKIAKWYKQGLWNKEKVRDAFERGVLTEADYAEIVGEDMPIPTQPTR